MHLRHTVVLLPTDVVIEIDLEALLIARMAVAAIPFQVHLHLGISMFPGVVRDRHVGGEGRTQIGDVIRSEGGPKVRVSERKINGDHLVGIEKTVAGSGLCECRSRQEDSCEKGCGSHGRKTAIGLGLSAGTTALQHGLDDTSPELLR